MKLNLISAVLLFMVISFVISEDDDDCTRCERYVGSIRAWNRKSDNGEIYNSVFEHVAEAVRVGCNAIYGKEEAREFCKKAEMTNWSQLNKLINNDEEWMEADDYTVCREKLGYC